MDQKVVFYMIETCTDYWNRGSIVPSNNIGTSYSERINTKKEVDDALEKIIGDLLKTKGSHIYPFEAYTRLNPHLSAIGGNWIIKFSGDNNVIVISVYRVTIDTDMISLDRGRINMDDSAKYELFKGCLSKISEQAIKSLISRMKGISNLKQVQNIRKEIEMFPKKRREFLLNKLRISIIKLQRDKVRKLKNRSSKAISEIK